MEKMYFYPKSLWEILTQGTNVEDLNALQKALRLDKEIIRAEPDVQGDQQDWKVFVKDN